jgi:hypothetical protein
MRRSGKDPLVQDSDELRACGAPKSEGATGPVPPDQQSPYGPHPPRERRREGEGAGEGEVDAILVGGPRNATAFQARSAALVAVEVDGLRHRYIRTKAHRQRDGRELTVYSYDGEVRTPR